MVAHKQELTSNPIKKLFMLRLLQETERERDPLVRIFPFLRCSGIRLWAKEKAEGEARENDLTENQTDIGVIRIPKSLPLHHLVIWYSHSSCKLRFHSMATQYITMLVLCGDVCVKKPEVNRVLKIIGDPICVECTN